MKISDILRLMADAVETDGDSSAFKGRLEPVELPQTKPAKPSPTGTTSSGNDKQPDELYLPPLQMKMELLKKAVDVDNVYDDGTPEQQEIERESKEGPWEGATHEYDYVGAPDSQGEDGNGDDTKDGYENAAVGKQDEVERLRKNAGMKPKTNPVVLSALADDSVTEE